VRFWAIRQADRFFAGPTSFPPSNSMVGMAPPGAHRAAAEDHWQNDDHGLSGFVFKV